MRIAMAEFPIDPLLIKLLELEHLLLEPERPGVADRSGR